MHSLPLPQPNFAVGMTEHKESFCPGTCVGHGGDSATCPGICGGDPAQHEVGKTYLPLEFPLKPESDVHDGTLVVVSESGLYTLLNDEAEVYCVTAAIVRCESSTQFAVNVDGSVKPGTLLRIKCGTQGGLFTAITA